MESPMRDPNPDVGTGPGKAFRKKEHQNWVLETE